jgi:hypothetical protein
MSQLIPIEQTVQSIPFLLKIQRSLQGADQGTSGLSLSQFMKRLRPRSKTIA